MSAPAIDELVSQVRFDRDGLVTVVAQSHGDGQVLMVAWMNETALRETLATGRVCYWSRSRGSLWRKGETSGQTQTLVEMRIDCDGDTLLALVDQAGVACHTGRRSCFFRALRDDRLAEVEGVQVDPESLYSGVPAPTSSRSIDDNS